MGNRNKVGWKSENSYAELPEIFYTKTEPTPVREPNIVTFNEELAGLLGLDPAALQAEDGIAILAGNKLPDGSVPLAQSYAGHQFGGFTRLGDGRAILL